VRCMILSALKKGLPHPAFKAKRCVAYPLWEGICDGLDGTWKIEVLGVLGILIKLN